MKQNQPRANQWQIRMNRLTEKKLLRAMRKRNRLSALKSILLIFILPLVILGDVLCLLYTSWGSISVLILSFLALLFELFVLYKQLRSPKADENHRLFHKYGNPEMVVCRLQQGAEPILFETKNLIFTDSYVMEKRNPASYIPYQNLLLYEIDACVAASLLAQSEADWQLITIDCYGDEFCCNLIGKEQKSAGTIRQILERKAPLARYGKTKENVDYVQSHCRQFL